jgi:hypothetical protein
LTDGSRFGDRDALTSVDVEEAMRALKISIGSAFAMAMMAATSTPGQAAPLPTNIGTIKSMLADNITPVRWVGWRGGWGGGWGGRGWGNRGWGRPAWGALAAGAVIGGALSAGAYYGGDPYYGYGAYPVYGGYGGYPVYGGYGGYDCYGYGGYGGCPGYGGGYYPGSAYGYYGW